MQLTSTGGQSKHKNAQENTKQILAAQNSLQPEGIIQAGGTTRLPRTSASLLMLTTMASPLISPPPAWLDSFEARLATEAPPPVFSCCPHDRWSIVAIPLKRLEV